MTFEAVEKKIRITLHSPLSSQDITQIEKILLRDAHVRIIKKDITPSCISYILSESTLLIFDSSLLILTCGKTPLHRTLSAFVRLFSLSRIQTFTFERRNFLFPSDQDSHFEKTFEATLNLFPPSQVYFYHIGDKEDIHFHFFIYKAEDISLPTFYEIFMEECSQSSLLQIEKMPPATRLDTVLAPLKSRGYILDHVFSPQGYSINHIDDQNYTTLHTSPEEHVVYMSLESSSYDPFKSMTLDLLKRVAPKTFGLLFTQTQIQPEELEPFTHLGYTLEIHQKKYRGDFFQFIVGRYL